MLEKVKSPTKQYTKKYKAEAIKLMREIETTNTAIELDVPKSTLSQWIKLAKAGDLDTVAGSQAQGCAMTQAMDVQKLRSEINAKEAATKLDKYIKWKMEGENPSLFFVKIKNWILLWHNCDMKWMLNH